MVKQIKIDWKYGKILQVPRLEKKDKVLAIVQARQTSTRFPNKIYEELNGCPILYHTVGRAAQSPLVNKVVIASPHPLDNVPCNIDNFVFEGDEADVLTRFYWCAKENPADYYVRLTSDCPLLAPSLITTVIYETIIATADYCSNVMKLTFPDGLDTEVISKRTLDFLHGCVKSRYHREHVTSIIRDSNDLQDILNCISIENATDLSKEKYSVDVPEDLVRLRSLENIGSYI